MVNGRHALAAVVLAAALATLVACHSRPAAHDAGFDGDTREDAEADGEHLADGDPDSEADACVPSCLGRECGPDGCGGICPPGCDEHEACDAGSCECIQDRKSVV